jgi:hypothetical protein
MAIVLDTASIAEIDSYTGLTTAVENWLDRDDYNARVPYFIALAEAHFRRILVNPEREKRVTLAAGGAVDLPDDYDSARALYVTMTPSNALTQVSPSELYQRYGSAQAARPQVYSVTVGQIVFGPSPDADYAAKLIYNAKIPSLNATTQTNWLLDEHPDVYLYGALFQAEIFGWNDERATGFKTLMEETLDEINGVGNRRRYSGPLTMRPSQTEAVRGAYRR